MMGVEDICKEVGVSYYTVLEWIGKEAHPFSQMYTRAKKLQAYTFEDKMLAEAMKRDNDTVEGINGTQGNAAAVQRSKLIIDTLKWQMSKTNPKKYGDKIEVDNNHTGNVQITGITIQPIEVRERDVEDEYSDKK